MTDNWPWIEVPIARLMQAMTTLSRLGVSITTETRQRTNEPTKTICFAGASLLGYTLADTEKPTKGWLHPIYMEAEEKADFDVRGQEHLRDSFSTTLAPLLKQMQAKQ